MSSFEEDLNEFRGRMLDRIANAWEVPRHMLQGATPTKVVHLPGQVHEVEINISFTESECNHPEPDND